MQSVTLSHPGGDGLQHNSILSTYYDQNAKLAAVAIDPLNGRQVSIGGLNLVGKVPSELEDQFMEFLDSMGLGAHVNQHGNLSSRELGIVLRVQRVGDVVLSRPVFVCREWAARCGDVREGPIPQSEWDIR